MKKRTVILLSLLSLTLILEACNLVSQGKEGTYPPKQAPSQTQINQESLPASPTFSENYIGESKALEIALAHANIKTEDLLFSKSTLDYDDRKVVYDVEFFAQDKEYDYEIDASTGNIISFDTDMEYNFIPPVTSSNQPAAAPQEQPTVQDQTIASSGQPSENQSQASSSLTEDQIKQIALNKVPGATMEHIRIKQDYDDGRMIYEGKIIYQQMEYDFEIDSLTGNILDWEAESIYD